MRILLTGVAIPLPFFAVVVSQSVNRPMTHRELGERINVLHKHNTRDQTAGRSGWRQRVVERRQSLILVLGSAVRAAFCTAPPALQDCSYCETLSDGRMDYLIDRVGTALFSQCCLQ